jgi:hypothetical protein
VGLLFLAPFWLMVALGWVIVVVAFAVFNVLAWLVASLRGA